MAPKTEDFVKEVAISDMFEMKSSKLAQQKGGAGDKTFAGQMVTDHTKTTHRTEGLGLGRQGQGGSAGRAWTVRTRASSTSSRA